MAISQSNQLDGNYEFFKSLSFDITKEQLDKPTAMSVENFLLQYIKEIDSHISILLNLNPKEYTLYDYVLTDDVDNENQLNVRLIRLCKVLKCIFDKMIGRPVFTIIDIVTPNRKRNLTMLDVMRSFLLIIMHEAERLQEQIDAVYIYKDEYELLQEELNKLKRESSELKERKRKLLESNENHQVEIPKLKESIEEFTHEDNIEFVKAQMEVKNKEERDQWDQAYMERLKIEEQQLLHEICDEKEHQKLLDFHDQYRQKLNDLDDDEDQCEQLILDKRERINHMRRIQTLERRTNFDELKSTADALTDAENGLQLEESNITDSTEKMRMYAEEKRTIESRLANVTEIRQGVVDKYKAEIVALEKSYKRLKKEYVGKENVSVANAQKIHALNELLLVLKPKISKKQNELNYIKGHNRAELQNMQESRKLLLESMIEKVNVS